LRFSGNNFGTSGTQLIDCYIGGLNHHTRLLSTSVDLTTPFAYPSAAIQISGEPVRAIQFIGCTIIGRDDILAHTLRTGDANFIGCYFEGQNARGTLNGTLGTIPAGARLIAASALNSLAPYPAGSTTNMRFTASTWGPGVDRSPRYGTTAAARFVTGLGLFKPREVFDDKEAFPEHASELRMENTGDVRVVPGTGKFFYVGPATGDADIQSTSGSLNMRSGLRMRIGSPTVNWWAADAARFAPQAAGMELGNSGATNIFAKSYVSRRYWSATVWDGVTATSPEGVETGGIGSTCRSLATGELYKKKTGAGNTGWLI
jgi:hypothetical protein